MAKPSKQFEFTVGSDKLVRGLRPSKRDPRDSGYLVECKGAVGYRGALQTLDTLTRLATTAITDPFPYPQLFVFTNLVLVCGQTAIYEWVSGGLTLRLGSLTAGSPWTAIDLYDFIYLSNGKVAVTRDPSSKVFATSATLPIAEALVNYNGQVLAGGLV